MLFYWLLFIIPASMALFLKTEKQYNLIIWITVGIFYSLIIGLRHDVGGDWMNYLINFERTSLLTFEEIFQRGDPGHRFVEWLMSQWGFGIYGVNLIYGSVFMYGLIKLSLKEKYPWLVVAVAAPYLITVVVMGYSRQGIAIGLFLLAISYLRDGKFKTYILIIIIAALFHKTALLLLPFGMFMSKQGLTFRILIMIPVAYAGWDLFLAQKQEAMWRNYVDTQMHSTGAFIRVIMNLVPSLLLLIFTRQWKKEYNDYKFWFWIAVCSIILVGLVNSASTAVDRVALYFIPIQMIVFARLPLLAEKIIPQNITKTIIIIGYTLVLLVWLTIGRLSYAWIPYQNIIWFDLY